ncbi:MAG: polyribonucleotide nucleotidyltransferase, partial [Candidatus Wildermuthbacteria bacterium]|nr:polyribonucleotide nucleotidyltransferase [Candidatus Wildermuthbacteria bacterium]
MASVFKIKLDGKEISFEQTPLAEQANGAILARAGDTVALVTAVMSRNEGSWQGFIPLSVEYEERFYAAGKILGSRFIRRETRPTDEAILTARLIDRAIRPLFPKNLSREVQVIVTCLSWDGVNDPDIAALNAASLALALSDVPWNGPVAAVRVGRFEGKFILNPTYEERGASDLDFVIAGVRENNEFLVNMIEASAKEIPEDVFKEALAFARPHLLGLLEFQEDRAGAAGKQKLELAQKAPDKTFEKEVKECIGSKLKEALFQGDKATRIEAVNELKETVAQTIESKYPAMGKGNDAKTIFEKELDALVHEAAIKEGKRADGRTLDEIRRLDASVAILPRTHGSGLFSRGQTKTLSLVTLGAPGDQKILEGMEFIGKKRFLHHYNFPPYAPGEVKPLRGPGRREIGHGMLAEKALAPVIPEVTDFPYTIRIVTEVLSSNGSTSMASACSSSLALMDAGVPIKRPVAGISMGLMANDEGQYKLLTDIQGPEDHHGDMDF